MPKRRSPYTSSSAYLLLSSSLPPSLSRMYIYALSTCTMRPLSSTRVYYIFPLCTWTRAYRTYLHVSIRARVCVIRELSPKRAPIWILRKMNDTVLINGYIKLSIQLETNKQWTIFICWMQLCSNNANSWKYMYILDPEKSAPEYNMRRHVTIALSARDFMPALQPAERSVNHIPVHWIIRRC